MTLSLYCMAELAVGVTTLLPIFTLKYRPRLELRCAVEAQLDVAAGQRQVADLVISVAVIPVGAAWPIIVVPLLRNPLVFCTKAPPVASLAPSPASKSWEKIVAAWDDREARQSRAAPMVESVIFRVHFLLSRIRKNNS